MGETQTIHALDLEALDALVARLTWCNALAMGKGAPAKCGILILGHQIATFDAEPFTVELVALLNEVRRLREELVALGRST